MEKNKINWGYWRGVTCKQAEEFINASELDQFRDIAGEIVSSAVVCSAWDDNIHKVCDWLIVHGRGLQPHMAKHLIGVNTN